jgi:hypothetical protein
VTVCSIVLSSWNQLSGVTVSIRGFGNIWYLLKRAFVHRRSMMSNTACVSRADVGNRDVKATFGLVTVIWMRVKQRPPM